jgi:PAS domain S-box-containing protein
MKPDEHTALDTDPAVYKTLLESTRAIPWKIDWATATFSYIGPQIEQLLGREPSSWKTVEDWATRMHPDERAWAVDFCVAQSKAGVDHEADYGALTKDGRYVWIRDVVHVVRDAQGEVEALVGFMFDISERKKNEQQLLELQPSWSDCHSRTASPAWATAATSRACSNTSGSRRCTSSGRCRR